MSAKNPDPISRVQMLEQEFLHVHGFLPEGYLAAKEKIHEGAKLRREQMSAEGWTRDAEERENQHVNAELETTFNRFVDAKGGETAALCLSGGGIRSATFNLGVVQALTKHKLMKDFDYLSTVSGGGYLGSWFSAWMHRVTKGPDELYDRLAGGSANKKSDGTCVVDEDDPDVNPEPAQVRHLRQYSNYLTPRLGVLRPDTATLAATYIRNLLINWLVLGPTILGLALLPRMYLASFYAGQIESRTTAWAMHIAALLLMTMAIVVPILAVPSQWTATADSDPDRRGSRRRGFTMTHVMLLVGLPLFLSYFLLVWIHTWGGRELIQNDFWHRYSWIGVYILAPLAAALLRMRFRHFFRTLLAVFIGGMTVWLAVVGVMIALGDAWEHIRGFAIVRVPISMGLFFILGTMFVGLTSGSGGGDLDREWWGRLKGLILLGAFFWLAVMGIGLGGPKLAHWCLVEHKLQVAIVLAVVVVAALIGSFGGHSDSTAAAQDPTYGSKLRQLAGSIPVLCAGLALPVIMVLLAYGADAMMVPLERLWQQHVLGRNVNEIMVLDLAAADLPNGSGRLLHRQGPMMAASAASTAVSVPASSSSAAAVTTWRAEWESAWAQAKADDAAATAMGRATLETGLAVAGVVSIALIMAGYLMNFNRFSLHAIYRDRLVRAYLGASNARRREDAFTGFDPDDNIPMHHLRRRRRFCDDDLGDDANVAELAKMLCEGKDPFFENVRKLAADYFRALQAVTSDPAAEPAAVRNAVRRFLNVLLPDRRLVEHEARAAREAEKAAAEAGSTPMPCDPVMDQEVKTAMDAVELDGSPVMANRLLLERACFVKGRSLLRPVNKPQVPKPFHVINVALNLVDTRNLAWQHRKAASFTITPLHCGFFKGYRPSASYGGPITLGTAMTISGAAASPNMGYHSSPSVTLLMTLFNIRLGWWLGNPAHKGWLHRRPDPRQSVWPLFAEALGLTNDRFAYVYLSDGGHFDNIGLYEMVRRRCKFIVVCDATCDPECRYSDLGNSIRRIQSDMGIRVDIDGMKFYPGVKALEDGRYCAVGTIYYNEGDEGQAGAGRPGGNGVILYIKPAMHERAPADVYSHSKCNTAFPHEPTANQWFSESQFESYRRLGFEIVDRICKRAYDEQGQIKFETLYKAARLEAERVNGKQPLPVSIVDPPDVDGMGTSAPIVPGIGPQAVDTLIQATLAGKTTSADDGGAGKAFTTEPAPLPTANPDSPANQGNPAPGSKAPEKSEPQTPEPKTTKTSKRP